MPKITISKSLFYSLLGDEPDVDTLETMLVCAKAELDAVDIESVKIELNDTNRPDLWTTAGLVRQLKTYYYGQALPQYAFLDAPPAAEKIIQVESSVQSIRPYVAGFLVHGKTVDAVILDELIQIQEKLCDNFGQRRKALAIGLYSEKKIRWPVRYRAEDPDASRFMALGESAPQSLREILNQHPKGKEYGHLLSNMSAYPMLRDAADEVLSMPPIINSASLGAVQEGDDALFVECTGESLEMLLLACAIFACDCSDMGFEVEPVQTQYPHDTPLGRTVVAPQYFQENLHVSMSSVASILGGEMNFEHVQKALAAMGVPISEKNEKACTVRPPVYRNDFLHEVDVVEDIMIGHGLHAFTPSMPTSFTIGSLHTIERVSRRLVASMVGLGFQEMLFPYLGSKRMFVDALYPEEARDDVASSLVRVSNPISENYEFVRSSALAQLLEAERVSAHSPYPHKMFEIGKVASRDETQDYGTRTDTLLSFLLSGSDANFTEINSVIAAILYYEDMRWHAEPLVDARFIEKRCARIVCSDSGATLGVFGELHPRVLEAFDITMPCAGGQLCLDMLITRASSSTT